ncbi:MAG: polyhydroxyalkanoate synthesis repressor PhaR [Proteobacteria bacterium]|nr:polyhydroxyalkanoate synthesis repressor PhaR [Pseudomonadota bacterium]MDA1022552.1 polyhydroxyalkanoate synthesis repressor PhaR [Pseudomonadota bacterium]
MSEENGSEVPPVTIKKYANRRLYNTATSSYVTLDHLSTMVKEGTDFVVYDAKTGEDITRQILTHIIVEEEGKGTNLLPISFLRHLISFYGDSLQTVVPNYLDYSMKSFAKNQEQMRDYMKDTLGSVSPFGQFEDLGKKNMAMFEEAMQIFSPFMPGGGAEEEDDKPEKNTAGKSSGPGAQGAPMDDLRQQMEQMQQQIDKLSRNKKD